MFSHAYLPGKSSEDHANSRLVSGRVHRGRSVWRPRLLGLCGIGFLGFSSPSDAATITAASPMRGDVGAAYNQCVVGIRCRSRWNGHMADRAHH